MLAHDLLFDTLGVWVAGPLDVQRTKVISAGSHALAGAAHPFLQDGAKHWHTHRGYKASAHVFPVPAHADRLPNLAAECRKTMEEKICVVTAADGVRDQYGLAPWKPVECHPQWFAAGADRLQIPLAKVPPVCPICLPTDRYPMRFRAPITWTNCRP